MIFINYPLILTFFRREKGCMHMLPLMWEFVPEFYGVLIFAFSRSDLTSAWMFSSCISRAMPSLA